MTGSDEQAAAEALVSLTATPAHRENQIIVTATMINKYRLLANRFSLLAMLGSPLAVDVVSNRLRNNRRR
jgi:hypothetical protein